MCWFDVQACVHRTTPITTRFPFREPCRATYRWTSLDNDKAAEGIEGDRDDIILTPNMGGQWESRVKYGSGNNMGRGRREHKS